MKYKKMLLEGVFSLTCILNLCIGKNSVGASSEYTGHNSWNQLTTSNGLAAGIYSQKEGKLVRLQRHIFTHEKADSTTPNYMYDSYFGYRTNQKTQWLNNVPVKKAEYINGTNIIHATQKNDNLTFDSYYFTPFSGTNKDNSSLLYMLIKVKNNGPTQDISLFSQQNMHMGSDYVAKNEMTKYNSQKKYLKEFNSGNNSIAIYKNLTATNEKYQAGAGEDTPVNTLKNSNNLTNKVTKSADDIVAGYENSNIKFKSGQSRWFGVIIGLREDGNENALSKTVDKNAQIALKKSPATLLKEEEHWWKNWHKNEKMPKGLTAQEKRTYLQSTAVLKMSQVREKGSGYGQVLASLIPGEWSIAWVRDGSYSIRALIDSGHYREAKAALSFFLNAQMKKDSNGNNYYQTKYIENNNTQAPDYGLNTKLSQNYLLSVCRYYGNGTEESDYNDHGPNIEFDGWGLVLWTINHYVKTTGDYKFLLNNKNITSKEIKRGTIKKAYLKNTNWEKITKRDADLLIQLVNKKTGLLKQDSSIWEEHWTPYNVLKNAPARQQFAFTNITAWAGLKAAATMAKKLKLTSSYKKYNKAAINLKKAIIKQLVVKENGQPMIASSLERKGDAEKQNDGSTVEAINMGLVKSNSKLAKGMIAAFNNNLKIKTGHTPGFMRNQDGDLYDSREWGFIDLRIAGALAQMKQKKQAKVVINWMTSQAEHNYDLIPELLDYKTQDYAGSVPMGGFGSGSYILALNDYYK